MGKSEQIWTKASPRQWILTHLLFRIYYQSNIQPITPNGLRPVSVSTQSQAIFPGLSGKASIGEQSYRRHLLPQLYATWISTR